jgi:hypothetical protein
MRARGLIILLILTGNAGAAVRAGSSEYRHKIYGRRALIQTGGSSLVAHARNTPHEWGRGGTGLAKRVGSAIGTHAVKNTIQYGVAGLRHEDLRYHPSGKHGLRPRMEAALKSTVITRKTTTGKKTVGSGKIAGNFGSGLISRAWQPARLRTVSGGFATGGMMMGADATSNVVQEFWPEIRHPKRTMHHR